MALVEEESPMDEQKSLWSLWLKLICGSELIGLILLIVGLVLVLTESNDNGPGSAITIAGLSIMIMCCIVPAIIGARSLGQQREPFLRG